MSGEKTEPATPKRKRDARAKGDLPDIRDITTAGIAFAGALWIALAGGAAWDALANVLRASLSGKADGAAIATDLIPPFGALAGLTWVFAIAARAVGGGLGFSWAAVKPKWNRVDPAAGLKRIFSMRGLLEFGKSLAKLVLLGGAAVLVLQVSAKTVLALASGDPMAGMTAASTILLQVVAAMTVALVALAALDAPIQIALRNKRLLMSRQEVRDEHRESEQSAETRQQISAKRHALLDRSARGAAKEATVVLVNPTEFAVALRYRAGIDAAPVVVARARDEAALALRTLAQAENVPILSYPVLTRAIYFTSRAGAPVDEKLYRAVATVLAFVFSLDAALAARRALPEVDVPEACRFTPDGRRMA